MPTKNSFTTLEEAQDFSVNWANSSLVIKENDTTLATFNISSWTPQNINQDARCVSSPLSDVTAIATGTANRVQLIKDTKEYELVIGVNVSLNTTNVETGVTVTSENIIVLFPST